MRCLKMAEDNVLDAINRLDFAISKIDEFDSLQSNFHVDEDARSHIFINFQEGFERNGVTNEAEESQYYQNGQKVSLGTKQDGEGTIEEYRANKDRYLVRKRDGTAVEVKPDNINPIDEFTEETEQQEQKKGKLSWENLSQG